MPENLPFLFAADGAGGPTSACPVRGGLSRSVTSKREYQLQTLQIEIVPNGASPLSQSVTSKPVLPSNCYRSRQTTTDTRPSAKTTTKALSPLWWFAGELLLEERVWRGCQRIELVHPCKALATIVGIVAPATLVDVVLRIQANPLLRLVLLVLVAEVALVLDLVLKLKLGIRAPAGILVDRRQVTVVVVVKLRIAAALGFSEP